MAPVKQRNNLVPGFTNAPPFLQFLRLSWPDITTQLLCLAAALLLYSFCPPIMPRVFPVFDGYEASTFGLGHGLPVDAEFINTWVMAVIAYSVPALVMGAFGLWAIRDFYDSNAALTALGYALSTSTLFINLIKIFVGGFRPHFLAICDPIVIVGSPPKFFTAEEICTGNPKLIREALMSFPSGHATAAFAGFVFLSLFLNGRLKVFGFGRTFGFCQWFPGDFGIVAHWKLCAFVLPWCIATMLAASKVRDGWHHPIDVVFGAVVGTAFAFMAYTMAYRSVWNAQTNHIPW